MAQIRTLKIDSDGVPIEHSLTDDITFASFTVNGGGPVMGATGIDMNGQDVSDLSDLVFTDPAVGTINQTAGALIVNNIVAKERENLFTTAGGISFPVITDTAGQVDAFRLPALAGTPTASPTTGGEGHLVWDSTNNKMYAWDGAAWVDQTSVAYTQSVQSSYTAEEALAIRDAVYISSADNVSKALADNTSKSRLVGFAVAAASAAASVQVQEDGVMGGFSGLTAGSRYYLHPTSAGLISATLPSGSGQTIVQAGYAKSTTALHIQIQQLGRRA